MGDFKDVEVLEVLVKEGDGDAKTLDIVLQYLVWRANQNLCGEISFYFLSKNEN